MNMAASEVDGLAGSENMSKTMSIEERKQIVEEVRRRNQKKYATFIEFQKNVNARVEAEGHEQQRQVQKTLIEMLESGANFLPGDDKAVNLQKLVCSQNIDLNTTLADVFQFTMEKKTANYGTDDPAESTGDPKSQREILEKSL